MHFYRNYEEALFKMAKDEEQEMIRSLAADALHPRRSALVASIPEPGLAEKHDEKMEKYLQDLKAGMTEDEVEKLAADTQAFNAWNEEEQAGEFHKPMLRVQWSSLNEDFEESLHLLLSILGRTDLSQHELMKYILSRDAAKWDVSRQNGADLAGDLLLNEEFTGKDIPWIYALNDKYIVPELRFRKGAYSTGTSVNPFMGTFMTFTYSDPNAASSAKALYAMPDVLEKLEISQEELDGYILNAYGFATQPFGIWSEVMNDMAVSFYGFDPGQLKTLISDIRNAALDEQETAAEHLRSVMETARLATVGNEAVLKKDADYYDLFVSYRHSDDSGE